VLKIILVNCINWTRLKGNFKRKVKVKSAMEGVRKRTWMSCASVCVTISVCLCECNKAARKFLLQLTHLTVSLYCHLPISLFHTIVYIFLVTFFIRAAQFFRAPRPCYCVFCCFYMFRVFCFVSLVITQIPLLPPPPRPRPFSAQPASASASFFRTIAVK